MELGVSSAKSLHFIVERRLRSYWDPAFNQHIWAGICGKSTTNQKLGGGNSNIFYFHPYLGK